MRNLFLLLIFIIFHINELLAGPGGRVARDIFDSPLGKIVGGLLMVIFFPLLIRSWYKRYKSIRSTKEKLASLSRINFNLFDEINLKNRMSDIFMRVHKGWSERILDDCETYMTHWYRQNQQTVFLDEWDRKGLMNVCTIGELKSTEPIHLRLTDNPSFDGTRIMFAINANMEDYLVSVEDSSVLEGKKGFKDVETVWTLRLEDNVWKVDNIEQSEMVSSYMKMDSAVTDSIIENLMTQNTVQT